MKLSYGAYCLLNVGWYVSFALFIRSQRLVAVKMGQSRSMSQLLRRDAMRAMRDARWWVAEWRAILAIGPAKTNPYELAILDEAWKIQLASGDWVRLVDVADIFGLGLDFASEVARKLVAEGCLSVPCGAALGDVRMIKVTDKGVLS